MMGAGLNLQFLFSPSCEAAILKEQIIFFEVTRLVI